MKGFPDAAAAGLRLMMIFGVTAALAGWPGPAAGQIGSSLTSNPNYRLRMLTGGQCIQAINRLQGDVLVNHCNECRNAKIQYFRRGGGFPVTRTFRLGGQDKVDLSFKGSGRIQVVSDTPCDANSQAASGFKHCAKLATRKNGEPALINICPVCRGIVIERLSSNGRHDQEVFTLAGRTILPFPLQGAAQLRIVKELPCQK